MDIGFGKFFIEHADQIGIFYFYIFEVLASWIPMSIITLGSFALLLKISVVLQNRKNLTSSNKQLTWSPKTTRTLLTTSVVYSITHIVRSLMTQLVQYRVFVVNFVMSCVSSVCGQCLCTVLVASVVISVCDQHKWSVSVCNNDVSKGGNRVKYSKAELSPLDRDANSGTGMTFYLHYRCLAFGRRQRTGTLRVTHLYSGIMASHLYSDILISHHYSNILIYHLYSDITTSHLYSDILISHHYSDILVYHLYSDITTSHLYSDILIYHLYSDILISLQSDSTISFQ
ncbi:hypothetical protein Btru_050587 [Bulinus truncatus]|nr:hypothetical protein Btru_050587 [Bulinus truncatus]